MKDNDLSKFLCLILRHKPETIGIKLDQYGWANIDQLIEGINHYYEDHVIDYERLMTIVKEDQKNRYSINENGNKIRANQGHSIPVDVELKRDKPPACLYHGTTLESYSGIIMAGYISKMSRLYVHMQSNISKAEQSARRWKNQIPIVLEIAADEMVQDGWKFYLSENGVWLVDQVPLKYIRNIIPLRKE